MYKVLVVIADLSGKNKSADTLEKLLNGGWEIHHSQTMSGGDVGTPSCLMVLKKDKP